MSHHACLDPGVNSACFSSRQCAKGPGLKRIFVCVVWTMLCLVLFFEVLIGVVETLGTRRYEKNRSCSSEVLLMLWNSSLPWDTTEPYHFIDMFSGQSNASRMWSLPQLCLDFCALFNFWIAKEARLLSCCTL